MGIYAWRLEALQETSEGSMEHRSGLDDWKLENTFQIFQRVLTILSWGGQMGRIDGNGRQNLELI